MQTRRGFLKTLFGSAAAVATGGLGKVAEALTTKPAVAKAAAKVGFPASAFLESGYFFAPYIPLQVTPVFCMEDFKSREGLIRKYGNMKVKTEYYGTFSVGKETIFETLKRWSTGKSRQII